MIVRLNKEIRSYYAAPHTFTKQNPEQKVSAKLGRYLLKTGYFKEVEGPDDIDDEEIDNEVEASEQKKLYDETKEEAKKKSAKKDK